MDLVSEIINYYKSPGLSAESFYENIETLSLSSDVKILEDPFLKFFTQLGESLKKDKKDKKTRDKKRKQIEEAVQSLVERLKKQTSDDKKIENDFFEKEKEEPIPELKPETPSSEPFTDSSSETKVEEEFSTQNFEKEKDNKNFNPYVDQLKKSDSKTEPPSRLKKITDIREFIGKEISKQFTQFQQQFPNFSFGSSGGGTNAVQFAQGGTMNGNLNVTGKYLSGGRDLIEIFSTLSGNNNHFIPPNKLISDSRELILNSDGTITFPLSNTITSPENSLLNLESQSSLGTFTKIVLSPYGFFVYDQNSNSISFDSIDNDIVLTSQDQYEWKFNSEGILVGPQLNGTLAVSGLNSYGPILSGGIDIAKLIQSIPQGSPGEQGPIGETGPAGEQGSPGDSAYAIWLEQHGNENKTEQEFLDSLKGEQGLPGNDGVPGEQGPIGETGPAGDPGTPGTPGESTYAIWLQQPGNTGTELQFLSSLKSTEPGPPGPPGPQGLSGLNVFEVWLSAGNNGTFSEFLSSIKGEKGDQGIQGVSGLNTFEVWQSAGNEGDFNTFLTSIAPVKTVVGRTGDITLNISDINNLQATLDTKQLVGNYVELVNGIVPSEYLPGFVDEIEEHTNFDTLTSTGTQSPAVLYVTTNNNKIYRWGGSVYVEIVGAPGSSDSVVEGSNNKYFTVERAASAAPVQTVAGRIGNVILGVNDIQNLSTSLTATNTTTTPITAKLASNLGAYSNNTVIPVNTPFEIILRNLLTTIIPAVYAQPTLSVSVSPTTLLYEIGTNISPTLTPNFNKSSAGDATQFRVRSNSVTLSSGSTLTPFVTSFQLNSNTSFVTEVDYLSGSQLFDNVGNPSGTPILSGFRTATTTFTTFRNNFYTADANPLSASSSNDVRAFENFTTSRSFNIDILNGDKRVAFAFPSSLSNINVQVIQVGFGNITSSFTSSVISVSGANGVSPINYNMYTLLVQAGIPQNQTYSVSF